MSFDEEGFYLTETEKYLGMAAVLLVILGVATYIIFFSGWAFGVNDRPTVQTIDNTTMNATTSAATATANATAKATATAKPTVKPTATPTYVPTPTPVPPAPKPSPIPTPEDLHQHIFYSVVVTGPSTLSEGMGGTWHATVYKNGTAIPTNELNGQIYWYIDGNYVPGNKMMDSSPPNSATFASDANGAETTWSPLGVHTLKAVYTGVPSNPYGEMTVTLSKYVPTATPRPTL